MENQTFSHIFNFNINDYDQELHAAIRKYAKKTEFANEEEFTEAVEELTEACWEHDQFYQLEEDLGF